MVIDKYYAGVESCELCSQSYISTETAKLSELPDNNKKSKLIHAIIFDAQKFSRKPCIRILCREVLSENVAYHNICVEHLYELIDKVKEYEDNVAEEL